MDTIERDTTPTKHAATPRHKAKVVGAKPVKGREAPTPGFVVRSPCREPPLPNEPRRLPTEATIEKRLEVEKSDEPHLLCDIALLEGALARP